MPYIDAPNWAYRSSFSDAAVQFGYYVTRTFMLQSSTSEHNSDRHLRRLNVRYSLGPPFFFLRSSQAKSVDCPWLPIRYHLDGSAVIEIDPAFLFNLPVQRHQLERGFPILLATLPSETQGYIASNLHTTNSFKYQTHSSSLLFMHIHPLIPWLTNL